MSEWDVYNDGKYIGCVMARTEDAARCAAMTQLGARGDVSVSRR